MRAVTFAAAAISIVIVIQSNLLVRSLSRLHGAEPTQRSPSANQTTQPPAPADSAGKQVAKQEIDERAKQVLTESLKTLAAIGSIEFRTERDLKVLGPAPPGADAAKWPHRLKDSYIFRTDGRKWRVDEFNEAGAETRSHSFNGENYQYLDAELSMFRESRHRFSQAAPQTPFRSPISLAYEWAYSKNSWLSWEDLTLRENLEEILADRSFHVIGERKSDAGTVVTIAQKVKSSTGRLFVSLLEFDRGHDCLPLALIARSPPSEKPLSSVIVKRSAEVETGDGRHLRLPVEAELESSGISGVIRILENTLRINQPIDDEVFTLDRNRAKHVLGPIALDEKTADFFKTRGPLAERLAATQDDARRNHQRVLLILGDPESESSQRLFALREKDWRRLLYEYQQLPVGKNDAAAVEAFQKRYPELTNLGWPALFAIDQDGKALGSLSLTLSTATLAAETAKGREFLERYAFEKPDAERLLADALARAKREDKKVFIQQTGIYCAPCRLLSRFMEQHADLLDRSFVYLKIDASRSVHGPELIKRLRTDVSEGIPWSVILDADGKVVATWLGFPSAASNDVDDFVKFLASNAPQLTAEQLAQMRSDLNRKP